jgi:hypothetical protein
MVVYDVYSIISCGLEHRCVVGSSDLFTEIVGHAKIGAFPMPYSEFANNQIANWDTAVPVNHLCLNNVVEFVVHHTVHVLFFL